MIVPSSRRAIATLRGRLSSETRGLARDSFLLELASAASTIALIGQLAMITHSLGLQAYGIFALVVSVVSLVSRFFDAPVAYTSIAFGADKVDTNPRMLAGVFQFGYLVSLVTGTAGFLTVVAVAPFVGPRLIGEDGPLLLILFAITLVMSTVDVASLSLLRVLDRFDVTLWYTIAREVSRLALVGGALVLFHSVLAVVVALVIHDALTAAMGVVLAAVFLRRRSGVSIFQPSLSYVSGLRRRMLGMIFHTNVVSYGRLVETQAPTLLLGAFAGPEQVAILKIGQAAGSALARVTDPAWQALIPRAARLWSKGALTELRKMLLHATYLSVPIMAVIAAVVIAFRDTILGIIAGPEALQATTVLILACLAQVINGGIFWNLPLLYACKRAKTAARIYLVTLAILAPTLVIFTREWGATGAAIALLMSTALVNGAATFLAVRLIRQPRSSHIATTQALPLREPVRSAR
jgi:O-antigen/teichoic acid export membrane protein